MGYLNEHFLPLKEKYPNALDNVVCGADCGPGWVPIIEPVLALCEIYGVGVDQIKEKFGGLRIYTGHSHDVVDAAIHDAETLAWKTCEECGAEGKRRSGGWIRTLCEECVVVK